MSSFDASSPLGKALAAIDAASDEASATAAADAAVKQMGSVDMLFSVRQLSLSAHLRAIAGARGCPDPALALRRVRCCHCRH